MEIRPKLLGCSVTNINASVGWNGQESRLEVGLVEDDTNGDTFNAPPVGSPVKFELGGFKFTGLLENIAKNGGSSGSPLYSAVLVDPRNILNGVQVILSDYAGPTGGVHNILNVYGYLENFRFGGSGRSDGILWPAVVAALSDLINAGYTMFGGPISYKGYQYGLFIDNLPILPDYFTLSGTMSLMDLIQTVCDAAGCDFHCQLNDEGNMIVIKTINKNFIPTVGAITQFISQTPGAVSKNIGLNMVNEPTGKMLLGAKRKDLFFTTYEDANDNSMIPNPIWWFFGVDLNRKIIHSKGFNSDLTLTLDTRRVGIPEIGPFYNTSIDELRCAIASKNSWMNYLSLANDLQYLWNPFGQLTAAYSQNMFYSHNNKVNPHRGKSSLLFLPSNIGRTIIADFIESMKRNGISRNLISFDAVNFNSGEDIIYGFLRDYGLNFYGTKFLVKLDGVKFFFDQDTGMYSYSHIPTDAAFISEQNFEAFARRNLIPFDPSFLLTNENSIYCYCRYDNYNAIDMTNIPEDSFYIQGNSAFIKCQVEPELLIRDNAVYCVLTLPGKVYVRDIDYRDYNLIYRFIKDMGDSSNRTRDFVNNLTNLASLMSIFNTKDYKVCVIPNMVSIPLENQTMRYGPWYATGADGNVELEINDTLAPWTYGNFKMLDIAAEALIFSNTTTLQEAESGSIEFPGIPMISLGDQLNDTGPYVSTIQVNVGAEGVTTSYRMETWKNKFGILGKSFADKVQKYSKAISNIREQVKNV